MISRTAAAKALLIRRNEADGTHAFPKVEDAVADAISDAAHQSEVLFALTNSSKFLFSEKVLLAEGKTEHVLLPEIFALENGATFEERKAALIALQGTGDFPNAMRVLRAMGIPVRAVVDLDFAFKVAPGAGLIPTTHHGIVGCKEIFAAMAEVGQITLGQDGLPRGGNGVSAATAYAMMAERAETAEHIQAIHTELLEKDIWCWTKGAIETHLNLASKSAAEHCAFLDQFENADFREALVNYGPVRDMVLWAAN